MLAEYWQYMSLGVKYELVERQQIAIIAEQQVEILQRFSHEETLHLVPITHIVRIFDVVDGGVALGKAGVFLEGLEHLPAPVAVRLVACEAVEIDEALDCLRPQQVMCIGGLGKVGHHRLTDAARLYCM